MVGCAVVESTIKRTGARLAGGESGEAGDGEGAQMSELATPRR
jgi:hypothetical protein